jgi:hypothetical protein
MNPKKVIRSQVSKLTDLPNIGISLEKDLYSIGINNPSDLIGKDPYALYMQLCEVMGKRNDLCVLDVMISITDFMDGNEPRVWWEYTKNRKIKYNI